MFSIIASVLFRPSAAVADMLDALKKLVHFDSSKVVGSSRRRFRNTNFQFMPIDISTSCLLTSDIRASVAAANETWT